MCIGCTSAGNEETGPSLETGWFSDTASPENCPGVAVQIMPKEGTQNWYWRDLPTVWTGNARQETYSASLWQGATEIPSALRWEEGGLKFGVDPGSALAPDTTYSLHVTDCKQTYRHEFRTSSFGQPVTGGAASLEENTYLIDLGGATWVEPGGFASILALYFTTPILLMVSHVDESSVDFLGAQGYRDDFGQYNQLPTEPTFDFPLSPWIEKPYFGIVAPKVEISFSEILIPIYDFGLSGTFSADGASIGGAAIMGLGDTRNMGGLIGKEGNSGAICEQAAALGVSCQECPDGEPWCLFLTRCGCRWNTRARGNSGSSGVGFNGDTSAHHESGMGCVERDFCGRDCGGCRRYLLVACS